MFFILAPTDRTTPGTRFDKILVRHEPPVGHAFPALALAVCVVLGGCGAFAPQSGEPREPSVFRSVIVTNEDTVAHTVDVVVLHNGSVVYWTSKRVEAKRPANETNSTFDVVDNAVVAPSVIENTTRRYEVLIRLDNRTNGVRYALDETELDDCYSIGATIRDGQLRGPVVHHWNDDMRDYCAEPSDRTEQGRSLARL